MAGIESNIKTVLSSASLEMAVRQAIQGISTSRVLAQIEAIVKLRTAKGEYLEGSSPGHESYSPGHERKREKEGLPTEKVDLFFSGKMLDAYRGSSRFEGDALVLESGYIDGESESEAAQLANYHNRLGAGINKMLRINVGLADSEAKDVLDDLEREVLGGLR